MKILYVEDNPNDIDLLRRELNRTRHSVILETASTIKEAFEKIETVEKIDLVLIDMRLPDGNGLDVLSQIRRKNIPLPVIILTGQGDEEAAVNSLKAGADEYIPKKVGYYSTIPDAIDRAVEHYAHMERHKDTAIRVMYIEHNVEDVVLTKRHINRYAPRIHIDFIECVNDAFNLIITSGKLSEDYDVVLLDYRLPEMNASEIIELIVKNSKHELPIIIVTGQGNEEIAAQALRLGAYDYIVKNPGYLFKLPSAIQSAYERVQLLISQQELKKKNEELDNFFNYTIDMLCITDVDGNFININREWSAALGYDLEEISSKNIKDFIHPDDRGKADKALAQMKNTHTILNLETRYLAKDGLYHWLEWRSCKIDQFVYSAARDITRRISAEQQLRQSKEYFTNLLDYSNVPIIVWDADMKTTFFNRAFERISGYSTHEVFDGGLEKITQVQDKQKVQHFITQASKGHLWENVELAIQAKDGSIRWLLWNSANVKSEDNETIVAIIAQGTDITELKLIAERNAYLSIHDHLTGLYNRVYYDAKVTEFNTDAHLPLTVVFADINGLKLANDAYGYSTGDKLVCLSADTIKNHFRDEDVVIRMGGDEFLILMPKAGTKDAESIVQQIRAECQALKVETIELSISFGINTKSNPQEDFRDIIKKAEDHMYRVKLFESPSMRGKTIYAILNTLHEKNKREELHSRRVSKLCETIGQALNMTDNNLKDLITVGLLHDIGKVAVRDSYLNKPGPLSNDEWDEIKKHPEIGFRIISTVNDVADLAQYVLYHHERWDGNGYPRGLKEDAIPLMSRIIAVADAYDAMTSPRPYRNTLSEDEAREEIRVNAGKQFDPEIANTFLEIVLKNGPSTVCAADGI